MLVLRMIFPTVVTRESPGVVQRLFSLPGSWTVMERNLYILKGRLWSPTRSWQKIMGPGDVSLMAMAVTSMMGENRMIPTRAPKISTARFTMALGRLFKGTWRIWMIGRPWRSSI